MSAPVPVSVGCCSTPCPTSPQTAVPGPAGENAFSFTVGAFVQPAIGGNVNVTLTHDGWIAVGQTVFVQTGGYYAVAAVSGLVATLTNLGLTGNASPGFVVAGSSKVTPGGVGGNVGNAWTTTTANFTQPAVGAQVNVAVLVSAWAAVGQSVFVATGGYYTVFSIPDATHLNLTNSGSAGNAAPTTVINSPQQVSPAGVIGATGPAGAATLNSISPTTTKGDIIVDNGANNPAASDVRVAAGTNGQLLAADSALASGVGYKSVSPLAVATDGDIAVFSGTTGKPMAIKDSKLLITANGAIQSTPSGGNARGLNAVDLQVIRALATQVASGDQSSVTAGENNTASGTDSAVSGGFQNKASGSTAVVCGGGTNTASGDNSGVVAGFGNLANAPQSFIGGGQSNVANGLGAAVLSGNACTSGGTWSTVAGGDTNTADGDGSVVSGGANNFAGSVNSGIPAGTNALTTLYGQLTHSSGQFAAGGDAQASELLLRINTTDATAGVEAFLDGAALRAVVPLNTTWAFVIHTVARSSAGVCAMWETKGAIQNNANTVSLVAAVTQSVIVDGTGGTWGITGNHAITADNVHKSLKVAVTGAVATGIRWVTHARLVEVGF